MLLLGAVLTVHGVALANYYFEPRYAREDTRAAADYLETAAGPRDVFLIVGTESSLPHYYKGNLPLVDFGTLQPAEQPLKEKLRKLSTNHDRIWLVQIRPWQVDRAGEVKAALDNAHNLFEQQHFPASIFTFIATRNRLPILQPESYEAVVSHPNFTIPVSVGPKFSADPAKLIRCAFDCSPE